MNSITIDIKRSLSARKFSKEERVHHDAFERACGLIDGQLKEILDGDISSYDETDGELDGTARSRK